MRSLSFRARTEPREGISVRKQGTCEIPHGLRLLGRTGETGIPASCQASTRLIDREDNSALILTSGQAAFAMVVKLGSYPLRTKDEPNLTLVQWTAMVTVPMKTPGLSSNLRPRRVGLTPAVTRTATSIAVASFSDCSYLGYRKKGKGGALVCDRRVAPPRMLTVANRRVRRLMVSSWQKEGPLEESGQFRENSGTVA